MGCCLAGPGDFAGLIKGNSSGLDIVIVMYFLISIYKFEMRFPNKY